jgi:hypothetical protein
MRHYWTAAEDEELRQYFADYYTEHIAAYFGLQYHQVVNRAYHLGLKKSEAFKQAERERMAKLLPVWGTASRIAKGTVPPNKGKKMSPEAYEKSKHTFFKKGHQPHNTKYDGHERICSKDGYILIRISKGKYVHKHRLIYELAHGPIPERMAVAFKDGNKLNLELSNLELVTRKELALRNSIHNYPAEMVGTIRLLSKLNKAIREKQK